MSAPSRGCKQFHYRPQGLHCTVTVLNAIAYPKYSYINWLRPKSDGWTVCTRMCVGGMLLVSRGCQPSWRYFLARCTCFFSSARRNTLCLYKKTTPTTTAKNNNNKKKK